MLEENYLETEKKEKKKKKKKKKEVIKIMTGNLGASLPTCKKKRNHKHK